MDAFQFLQQVSAKASADNPVPKTRLGFIDYDFNPKTYPQVLPRVNIDGEGLSPYGYVCISTYFPVPGDRVVLIPQGTSYIILGAIDRSDKSRLYPGTPVFQGFKSGSSSDQSVSTSGSTPVILDEEEYDVLGGWSLDQPTRYQPGVAGWYLLTGSIRFGSGSSGARYALWLKNGSSLRGSRQELPVSANDFNISAPTYFVYLNGTSDYVELSGGATSTTGVIRGTGTASAQCMFSAAFMGDSNNQFFRSDLT